jgi:hypothetical protein
MARRGPAATKVRSISGNDAKFPKKRDFDLGVLAVLGRSNPVFKTSKSKSVH